MIRRAIVTTLQRGEEWLFANPKIVLSIIFGLSFFFAAQIPGMKMKSEFEDLLPQSHGFIKLHNEIRDIFGGANGLVIAIEVENGTIFSNETLALIQRVTEKVDTLPGINHNLVSSLTYRTTRRVSVSEGGSIRSDLYYDPNGGPLNAAQLEKLQGEIVADPRVYGLLVSPDFKAAMVRAQMNQSSSEALVAAFKGLQKIREEDAKPGIHIYAVGNPVLTGWVYTYLPQILQILLYTAALITFLLVTYFRRLYGIALPLLGICLSSAWGLGFMNMVGFHLDPLSMPVPFLIAARATSHGVQLVERYYYELAQTESGKKAARNALDALFRPGSLAITVDAIGIAAIALGAAPINKHLGAFAGFWAFSVIFTVHFMVPLALTVLPQPKRTENQRDATSALLYKGLSPLSNGTAGRVILALAVAVLCIGSYWMAGMKFGESEAGSPILKHEHDYNVSARAIADRFPGTEELYIVARSSRKEGLREPRVMAAMAAFERYMLSDPHVGGAKGLPDLVRHVNRLTHEGDPRWMQLPDNVRDIGGLMYAYQYSSPIPGALKEFVNPEETVANLVFYFRDQQATTIQAAVDRAREGAAIYGHGIDGFSIELAAGVMGVNAAINEANRIDTMIVTVVVLLASFFMVMIYYSSVHAGWMMVLPMIFSTILTYAYMGFMNIGINVNTIPVVAVGMGVGIDYAIYVMDRVRDEFSKGYSLNEAVAHAVSTTGLAVMFTAATLVAGVVMWMIFSDLRFQADAALLLMVMLLLNAVAALIVVPAWILVFKPRFVTAEIAGEKADALQSAAIEQPEEAMRAEEEPESSYAA